MTARRATAAPAAAALALALALAAAPGAAPASNLGARGYPEPACGGAPALPARPDKFADEAALEAYNREVERYNAAMDRFVRCIQDYVDNASEDIRRIRALSREAIESARE